jgi:hypothetical protein
MATTTVELDRQEAATLLALVRARAAEVERMVQNMEEAEGMDLQRHNALKATRPQVDLLQTLTMKLEGAAKELEGRR